MDASTELGPLATRTPSRRLQADVDATVKAGAKVLTGGKPLDGAGRFYPPTVLTNIPKDSPGYREELFGPVACSVPRQGYRRGHRHRQRQPLRTRRQRVDERSG